MNFKQIRTAAVVLALSLSAAAAQAGIITVSSADDLAAKGIIKQTTSFDSYPSGRGEITTLNAGAVLDGAFSVDSNKAVIRRSVLSPRTLLSSNGAGTATSLDISGNFDLFGFIAAGEPFSGAASVATFDIITNLATYTFTAELPAAVNGFSYFGFEAEGDEYFTGFSLKGTRSLGVTDLQLGVSGPADPAEVPEPMSATLMLTGLGLAGLIRRRKA